MAKGQGKSGKRPDTRPARGRYWFGNHLERNKVRRIMRNTGMTKEEATKFWRAARRGRLRS